MTRYVTDKLARLTVISKQKERRWHCLDLEYDDGDDYMTKRRLISLDDSPFDNLKGYMVRLCINILPCQDANMIMV